VKCPNCGIDAAAGAADCAGCGVIFAKFMKKLDRAEAPAPAAINPWKGRAIAVAIVALWLAAFALYYAR
jgi:hypothetical protein